MAITLKTSFEAATSNGVKMIIYGESGAGKTTLLGGLNPFETLIITSENGLLSIAHKNMRAAEIETMEDLEGVYNMLDTPDYAWVKNVCMDSWSDIGEVCLANALKKCGADPRKGYGELGTKMVEWTKKFRDLKGRNVIMIAKLGKAEDETSGVKTYGPDMPGSKLGSNLPYLFDLVMALRIGQDPATKASFRYLQTARDLQWSAKDRSGALAPAEAPDLNSILIKIATKLATQAKEIA